jgi:hypothetical protein
LTFCAVEAVFERSFNFQKCSRIIPFCFFFPLLVPFCLASQ